MKLKLWGTRGSLPRAINHHQAVELIDDLCTEAEKNGAKTLQDFKKFIKNRPLSSPLVFGGNTACYEITHEHRRFFVDMGSGLAYAAAEATEQGRTEFIFFMTHMHWDHIMGFPFFVPLYIPGTKITIYHVHPNAPEHVQIQFNGVNFPVKWQDVRANIEFKKLKIYTKVTYDDVSITPFALDHPGGSFGYRFDCGGKSLAIGVDGEYKRVTRKELGKDLRFYQDLDLLLFDAQYELDELFTRYDWGHCSPNIGVDLALREGIRTLLLSHHDPHTTEEKERRMHSFAVEHLKSQLSQHAELWQKLKQPQGPQIYSAYDGLVFDLDTMSLQTRS